LVQKKGSDQSTENLHWDWNNELGYISTKLETADTAKENLQPIGTPLPVGIMRWSAVKKANRSNDGVGKKPKRRIITMQIKSIGIDLGKTTFHLVALGTRSQVVIRKKFSRSQLLEYTANLPPSLIGMEAGGIAFSGTSPARTGA